MKRKDWLNYERNGREWTGILCWYIVGALVFLFLACLAGGIGVVTAVIVYAAGFVLLGIWSDVQKTRMLAEMELRDRKEG